MAQMVGADLEFKPICSGAFRWNHDAGVVDEDVKVRRAGDELIRRLLQRVQIGEIEVKGADDGFGVPGTDSFQCVRGLGLVAARKNNFGPFNGELHCHLKADARVCSSDENDLSVLRLGVGKTPFAANFFPHAHASITAGLRPAITQRTGRCRSRSHRSEQAASERRFR